MNLIDLVVIALVAGAVAHGLMLGAAIQVASFAGLWAGLTLGAALAPVVARADGSPGWRAVLALVTLLAVTAAVSGGARAIGVRAWRAVRRVGLGRLDAAAGAVVAAVATLLAVWLVASIAARIPVPGITAEIQTSAILRALDDHLPAPPQLFSRLSRLLDPLGFPDVFAQFEPTPSPSLPLPADAVVRAAVAAAGRSTVKIEGSGCGGISEGSGFVVAPDLVVTNAHVVAGIRRPLVIDKDGVHRTSTVLFDPKLDVAVLRTPGVKDPPLQLLPRTVARGTEAAVLGYPGGGPFQAKPAVVLSEAPAVGRDIYGRGITTRDIYQLRAEVRPGNSGGPLVRSDGFVVGVVFARSSLNPDLGFALTSVDVRDRVTQAEARRGTVTTGSCAA